MSRYWIRPCFGTHPTSGRPVGERHRWSGGKPGVGQCVYCHRTIYEVRYLKPQPTTTVRPR